MNNKIPVKKLAEKLAAQSESDISVEKAEMLIKETFSAIIDKLACGESVTLNGLGTFSVSFNPNDPVTFTPDPEFAAEVNAPFSMFEAEELNDGVDVEQLQSLDIETGQNHIDDINECHPATTDAETDKDSSITLEKNDNESTPNTQCPAEQLNNVENCNPTETQPEEMLQNVSGFSVEKHNTDSSKSQPESEPSSESYMSTTEEHADDSDITYIPEDEEEFVEYTIVKSRFGIGVLVGLLIGLVIGALAFIGYMIYFIN